MESQKRRAKRRRVNVTLFGSSGPGLRERDRGHGKHVTALIFSRLLHRENRGEEQGNAPYMLNVVLVTRDRRGEEGIHPRTCPLLTKWIGNDGAYRVCKAKRRPGPCAQER